MRPASRVVLALLMTVLTACGSAGGSWHGKGDGGEATGAPASTSPSQVRAVSVTYTRAGGKTGLTQVVQIARDKTGKGYDKAKVRDVLAAASRPELRTLHLPLMPQDLCCDRYVYTIRVSWSDGSTKTFRTADGLRQPSVLRRLLAALA
jgi:hypothetical protein